MISMAPPFVLRLSKDERRVFQRNRIVLFVTRDCVLRIFLAHVESDSCVIHRSSLELVDTCEYLFDSIAELFFFEIRDWMFS